jgi:hypothetical protein
MQEIRQAGMRIGEDSFRGTSKGSLEICLSQVLFAAAPTPNPTAQMRIEMGDCLVASSGLDGALQQTHHEMDRSMQIR